MKQEFVGSVYFFHFICFKIVTDLEMWHILVQQ